MNNNIKKWLPALISIFIILLFIIISLIGKSTLPLLSVKDKKSVDINEVNKILATLDNDNEKSEAEDKLEKLYSDCIKDDVYYLAKGKIIMANSNKIDAVGVLNNVKNKTDEYYRLMILSTSGEYFTMGRVPDRLLDTSIEAANKYSNSIDFQLLAGELYYDKDNYTAAIYYLDRALQIDPDNIDGNYYYGLSIYLLGEKEIGLSYMEDVKKLYKGNDTEFKKSIDNYINIMKEGKR